MGAIILAVVGLVLIAFGVFEIRAGERAGDGGMGAALLGAVLCFLGVVSLLLALAKSLS